MIKPESMLEETDSSFVKCGKLYCEPGVLIGVELVHKLEQRTFFKKFATDIGLDFTQNLKKLSTAYSGMAHQFFHCVRQS